MSKLTDRQILPKHIGNMLSLPGHNYRHFVSCAGCFNCTNIEAESFVRLLMQVWSSIKLNKGFDKYQAIIMNIWNGDETVLESVKGKSQNFLPKIFILPLLLYSSTHLLGVPAKKPHTLHCDYSPHHWEYTSYGCCNFQSITNSRRRLTEL